MIKRRSILSFFATLFSSRLSGQNANDSFTGGFANGRFWKALSVDQRMSFLIGLSDGLSTGARDVLSLLNEKSPEPEKVKATMKIQGFYFGKEINNGEMSSAVTKLYDDPLNARCSITNIMFAARMQFEGAPAKEVAGWLELARQDAAEK